MFIEDKLDAARVDFDYAFADGPFGKLEFGVNYSKRTKSRASDENTLCLAANCASSNPIYGPVPSDAVVGSSPAYAGIGGVVDLDLVGMLNGTYVLSPKNHPDINNKNWEVTEKLLTAYIQATIDTELWGAPLTGNVGVQAVRTEQSSDAISQFNGVPFASPSVNSASYTDVLPSLNLKLGLPSEINVRFGLGRQMARPRMDEMVSSESYSYNPNAGSVNGVVQKEFTGNAGNSTLRPWIANAVDLSVEKYFGGTGYVTAGLFFKDLQSYIYSQTVRRDFSSLPLPFNDFELTSRTGWFTQPVNGQGGSLQGYEVAVNIPFETIWKPLDGFGFQGNYSDTTSSIHPGGGNARLPGLSKYISNMSLYFERWGFSARVSQRSRSAFRGEVEGFGGDRDRNKFFAGEKVTDFQMGYAFQSGALQGLSVLLQMYNVENDPAIEPSTAGIGYPGKYTEYGRTYLFGVNYKF
jgi:iron complex outermembrane receptor protein